MRRWLAAMTLALSACSRPAVPPLPVSADPELPATCGEAARSAIRAGWDALDRGERERALRMFEKAHRNDAECVLALAHRGALMTGEQGNELVEEARRRAVALSPAERLQVELLATTRSGDAVAALAQQQQLAEAYPVAWRAQLLLGRRLSSFRRYAEADAVLVRATELAPDESSPFEILGWTRLEGLRDPAGALAPLARWAELRPDDAKARQLHGTALALNGRLAEAEAELLVSVSLAGRPEAWDRLAWVRALRGDADGTRAALAEWSRSGSAEAKVRSRAHLAWLQYEEGKIEEALATVGEAEALAGREGIFVHQTGARMTRGIMLTLAGRHVEAMAALESAETDVPLPIDECGATLRWMWHRGRVHAALAAGDARGVAESLGDIRALPPEFPFRALLIDFADGERLLREGKTAEADERFARCAARDTWCAAHRIEIAVSRGAAAEASALRAAFLEGIRQEPMYLYFRSRNRSAAADR